MVMMHTGAASQAGRASAASTDDPASITSTTEESSNADASGTLPSITLRASSSSGPASDPIATDPSNAASTSNENPSDDEQATSAPDARKAMRILQHPTGRAGGQQLPGSTNALDSSKRARDTAEDLRFVLREPVDHAQPSVGMKPARTTLLGRCDRR
jgi:hypothetical protein